jgi:hypothetical protein
MPQVFIIICRGVGLGVFQLQFTIFVCYDKKLYRERGTQIGHIRKACIALVLVFDLCHMNINTCSATNDSVLRDKKH